jgi:uncharacterized protein with GYD domain
MTAYTRGRRREWQSRRHLEAAGYAVVRAAGSHGAFDLVAFSPADVVLVQVKSNRWPGTVEMAALRAFPAPPHTRKEAHRWRAGARTPDVRPVPA